MPGAFVVTVAEATRARDAEPRHVQAQRTARRAETPAGDVTWWVNGHPVHVCQLPGGGYLTGCACAAAQHGRRCYHLAVAVDEEACWAEAQRVRARYALAKRKAVL